MKFSAHVNSIIAKSKSAFHGIINLKKAGLKTDSLALFYRARILPILSYGAPAWYPFISKDNKDKLEKYQRLCLRVILPFVDRYSDRLHQLNMIELNTHLDTCCLKYVSKVRSRTDHPLRDLIPQVPEHLHHKSRATHRSRTELLGKSLFFRYR